MVSEVRLALMLSLVGTYCMASRYQCKCGGGGL